VWGTLFFYTYAQDPNGDLVLENADGVFVGAKI
jgi:hypothetical protein